MSFLISPAQDTLKNNLFYYEPLGWKIFIPNEFKPIPQHELQTMGNQAADLFFINDSLVNVVNSSFLFAVKSDEYHYMDVKVVQIHPDSTEEFYTSWKSGFDLLIKVRNSTLPNSKFDSLSYEESISGVVFNVQRFYIQINENSKLVVIPFSLF
jgi:hypothetical protein